MIIRKSLTFVALVLALSACEQPSAVAVDVEPAFMRGRVVASASGDAILPLPGSPLDHRTFTLHCAST